MNIKFIAIFTVTVTLLSCRQVERIDTAPDKPLVNRLLSPVQLTGDSTVVYLSDYFPNPDVIDSVITPNGLSFNRNNDIGILFLTGKGREVKPISLLTIWCKGAQYDIPVKRDKKLPVTITFDPQGKSYGKVQLAGQLNDWNPQRTPMHFNGKTYSATLRLNPGKYHYKLVVDGKWILDPNNTHVEDNGSGGQNSVLLVGNPKGNKQPLLIPDAFKRNELHIRIEGKVDTALVLWENHRIPTEMVRRKGNDLYISIPDNARRLQRSHLRIWAYGPSGETNNLLIPLEYTQPVTSPNKLKRTDFYAQVIYFLMVDRFCNGNPANDFKLNDPEVLPKANYYGGDLEGVLQKLKDGYFTSLGINTIWLSPITQNPMDAWGLYPNPRTKFSGYHGYWPVSSTKIDFRFGTPKVLDELLEVAHQKNINVILDYVANHVHKQHPVYRLHPEWATSLYLPDGSLNTERWDDHRLTTWFDVFLPTLNLERPEVYEPMTDSALFWLTRYPIDGFRHDATKHIHENFWRCLTRKIRLQVNRPIYQIGETYGSRELVGSYIGSGMLDAQFDFNLYDAVVPAFARKNYPFSALNASLLESLSTFGWINLMGNITGNQDRGRFISYAGGSLRFDEDAKLAGWTRNIGVGDSIAYRKLQMLNAFNLTVPGIPTIYYGDEFGMPGGNDPDNRRMMRFDKLNPRELETRKVVTELIALRRSNMALLYGTFDPILVNDSCYVYLRKYLNNVVLVAFNKSEQPITVTINLPDYVTNGRFYAKFGSKFLQRDGRLSLTLKANGFDVLVN